jgi:hypothetical protein
LDGQALCPKEIEMNKLFIPLLLLFVSTLFCFSSALAQPFVGSKNSNKYHKLTCNWAQKISPSSKVTFKTASDAATAGYQPCRVCNPPAAKDEGTPTSRQQSVGKQQTSTDTQSQQCQAITKKGTQCKRKAVPGSKYCWQHSK